MKTFWVVKHKSTGTYSTPLKATPAAAWEEFWFKIEQLGMTGKIEEDNYTAVEVVVTETGSSCNNNEW